MNPIETTKSDISDQSIDEAQSLSRDDIFALLSNARRRYVIQYVRTHGATRLGDLAERIAARENDTTRDQVSSDQRRRVYTSLQQTHLPKLRKNHVISYDQRSGEVEVGPALDDIDGYLEVDADDDPWGTINLTVSLLGGGLLLATTLNVHPFKLLPASAIGGTIVGLFLVSSVGHLYHTRYSKNRESLDVSLDRDS